MMRLRKGIYALLATLSILLMLLSTLLFTEAGNRLLWQHLTQQLPNLQGELISGTLRRGWVVENFEFHDQGVDVVASRLKLDWELGQLLNRRLWIKELALSGASIDLNLPDTGETESESTPLVLPLRVDLDKLSIDSFAFTQPDLKLTIASLQLAAHFGDEGLRLENPQAKGIDIALSATTPSQAETAPPAEASDLVVVLPKVTFPFPVQINNLAISQSRYQQPDYLQIIDHLELSATAKDQQLTLKKLRFKEPRVDATLSGTLLLDRDYPLDLKLQGKVSDHWLDRQLSGQTLTLKATGSVAKLKLEAEAKGHIPAKLIANLAPLDPKLPFSVALNWQDLTWPLNPEALPEEPIYHVNQGNLIAKGSLDNYQFTLKGAALAPNLPGVSAELKGEGNLEQLKNIDVALDSEAGAMTLTGALSWQHGISAKVKMALNEFNPALFAPEVRGRLSGKLDAEFTQQEDGFWQLQLPQLMLKGALNEAPLALDAALNGNSNLEWKIKQLRLSSGKNQLQAQGEIDPKNWDLTASINAPQIRHTELRGDLTGSVQLKGNAESPQISAHLQSKGLYLSGLALRGVALNVENRARHQLLDGEAELTVANLKQGESELKKLVAKLSGTTKEHQLALTFKGNPVGLQLALKGSLDDQNKLWNGTLQQWRLRTPLGAWTLQAPWTLTANQAEQKLAFDRLCLNNQDPASPNAKLCLQPAAISAQSGSVAFALQELDLALLKPWLPDQFSWQARLAADGVIGWEGSQPHAKISLHSTPGVLKNEALITRYQRLVLDLNLESQRAQLDLGFASNDLGAITTHLLVDDPQGAGKLSGDLQLKNFKPDGFAPLIPEVRSLGGIVSGNARFDGSLASPLLYGEIALVDGSVRTYSDMVMVNGLESRLRILGNRATIDGKMLVGKGQLNLGGWVDWQNQPLKGLLSIAGSNLEARYPNMGEVKVSPQLEIALGDETKIRGEITIPWARIKVKELPQSAIPLSDDVIVVTKAPSAPSAPVPLNLAVTVRLGDDVKIDAMGLKSNLLGEIRLQQDPGQLPTARGAIQLEEGRFKAYGQNLMIQEGEIRFNGPIDVPYLNIDAMRDPSTIDGNVTVGVLVTGSALKPEIKLYSTPQLTEAEQLSYLLQGRGLQTNDKANSANSGNALNSLLVAGAVGRMNNRVSGVGEQIGLTDMALDTAGSGDDTQVTISAYLLPGLQFNYGVGVFSSFAEFKLRYELMPKLYLQAMTGVAQAVDIFYRFEWAGLDSTPIK